MNNIHGLSLNIMCCKKGMTPMALSERTKIPYKKIQSIFNGKSMPNEFEQKMLAEVLNFDPKIFFGIDYKPIDPFRK